MLQTSFRKVMTAAVLALPMISLNVQSALADRRDFTVVNKTKAAIQHLYVSHAAEEEWGEDVLGKDFLGRGESTLVYFTDKTNVCVYDLKATFEDDDSVEAYKVNLCDTRSYTFTER